MSSSRGQVAGSVRRSVSMCRFTSFSSRCRTCRTPCRAFCKARTNPLGLPERVLSHRTWRNIWSLTWGMRPPGPRSPLLWTIVARAAECARLQPSAPPPPPSVFDRDLRRRGRSEGLPVFPDFMSELLSSWGAPSRASLPRTHLANLEGAAAYGVATAPRVGPTFAMLAGATVRVGCEASHPNSRCRATDGRLCKAYNASAMIARLACSNSLLLVYLEGLLQDLSSTGPAEGSEAVVEMLCVVDILICGARDQAQALGQAIASLVQARRQVWLAQSKLTPQDCSAVLAAPVVPGEVFGPPSEAALEQSRKTRELMRSVQRTPAASRPWPSGRA